VNMKRMMDKLPKHKFVMDPKSYRMAHPVYALQDIESIKVTHKKAENLRDKIAYGTVWAARTATDLLSRYNPDKF